MSIRARILPVQIPQFWEAIKFVCVQVNEVSKEEMPSYFNELLHALLSDKAQCFIRLGDDRTLEEVAITRIIINKITGEKYLFLQCLYSFKATTDDVWKQGCNLLIDLAKKEGCSYISFNSRHERIWEIGKMLGFKEKYKTFELKIGGV